MSFRMWKNGNKTNDYKLFDKLIGEQYIMGGVDAWLYTYEGPKIPGAATPPTLTTLADPVFGENAQRSYNTQAITLAVAYQIQEATPDMKLPGLFYNFETMDITIHYNTMMQRVGRKIIAGDVLELPNLRDTDVIGKEVGLNRFYVVTDSFKASEGYSATWQHHIWKLRVKPITDSPEFEDILGDNSYADPDDPNNPDNSDGSTDLGNGASEIDIMNRILAQTESEVPYIHFDKEHIYDDATDNQYLMDDIISGYEFPVKYYSGMYFMKDYVPELYEKSGDSYVLLSSSLSSKLPDSGTDGEFIFIKSTIVSDIVYVLYQYYGDEKKWIKCDIKMYANSAIGVTDDFYVLLKDSVLMRVNSDGVWENAKARLDVKPFTSNDIAWNPHHPHDQREAIPPARGDVGEGSQFPSDAVDGQYFYRTDYTPVQLWKYNAKTSTWTVFNYGGRKQWTGATVAMQEYVNSPDKVSIHDVVLPNIKYRK